MKQSTRDDRVLPVTRWVAVGVVAVLLGAGITLYGWPAETERLFAWTIRPVLTPLFMGAGYLMGAYFWARTALAARWHHVGAGLLPITIFAWAMLLATVLHWDRFNYSHLWFFIWIGVYCTTPLLVPYIWYKNQQRDPGIPDHDDLEVPRWIRWALAIAGGGELVLGLAMFMAPAWAISFWPWSLTPLTARVIGGWIVTFGLGGVIAAREPRWSAVRILIEGTTIWSVLQLFAFVRAWSDLDQSNMLAAIFVGNVAVTCALLMLLYLWMELRRRWLTRSRRVSVEERMADV